MTWVESNSENLKAVKVAVREPVTSTVITLIIMCTILVGFSLYWNINNLHEDKIEAALAQAKANWNKDQAFRGWATRHGGLYVRPDERTQPSPYLAHLPNRDVVTTNGMKLTLLNPAFMMRQMTKEYEDTYGIKGKITGKLTINPVNIADEWELKALDAFYNGVTEFYETTEIGGAPFLRYMKPMIMKEGCVPCHGYLGFKVGDIRGGVSISIPLQPYLSLVDASTQSIFVTHFVVLVFGCMGILGYGWAAKNREIERISFENERKQHQEKLEERVKNRTEALKNKEQEAKESTRRLELIMDNAAEGIITSSKEGIIESFNRAAEDMFGYKTKDVIGKNINLLVPMPDKQKHDAYIQNYLKTGISTIVGIGRDVEAQRKDGSFFPVSIAVSDTDFGYRRIFTAVIRDNTRTKQNERALIHAKEDAEKANQVKTDFLSSMSHDLRTPLNAILGFGQLLGVNDDEPLTELQGECVEQIMQGGHHLLHMINDILDLARIEAGELELKKESIILGQALDECMTLVKPLADEHKIKLVSNYKTLCDKHIEADNTRLKQVLLNLVSNAIKYNQEGGAITIECHEALNNMLRINVIDTGFGIAQEMKTEIFKPFCRLGAEGTEIEGTGIGLTVSKKLIELMNGHIGFESELGKGSTFWIELPLNKNSEQTGNEKLTEDAEYSSLFSDRNVSLLYVEDNLANMRLMEVVIDNMDNITMISAANAEDGIELAKEKQPDVIILDINLPGMNGFEALKILKASEKTADIPVLALSAAAAQEDIEKGIEAGFSYYLTKPMNIKEVASAIKSVLEEDQG